MTTRILTGLSCLLLVGCGDAQPPAPPPGPTYAEALTIYNQELELLERLKTSAALGDVVKDLQSASDLAAAGSLLNEEDTAKAQAASEKARNQLGEMGAKASAEIEKTTGEHDARMAELNKSIAQQEEKVARARQVKEEAEQRQQ